MWFIGLLLGAALGSLAGGDAALAGGLLGLVLGVAWKRQGMSRSGTPSASTEQRLRTLEAQVDWLHRDAQALRAELAQLRGDPLESPVEAVVETPALASAALAAEAAPPDALSEAAGRKTRRRQSVKRRCRRHRPGGRACWPAICWPKSASCCSFSVLLRVCVWRPNMV
jgi:hypothetical protein